jgi:spore coat protein U-like protein
MIRRRVSCLLLLPLLAMLSTPAHAVLCLGLTVVSGTPVAFLNYDPVSATDKDAAGLITVGCAGVGVLNSFTVKLNAGSYGTLGTRQMGNILNTSQRLDFNLYRNHARTQIWGDGTSSTFTQTYDTLVGLGTKDFDVYGRIPKGQDSPAGTYQSTITITVDF